MAEFNLNLEQVNIREYINGVTGEYVRFMDRNNIDWTDESNEYVAAKAELLRIKDNICQMTTEEEIRKYNARVDEIRAKIKNAENNKNSLILTVGELEIYIDETEKLFVELLRSKNIKWTDTSNEYVIALEELYDIKNDTDKIDNIETANKVRARVEELREMAESQSKVMAYFNTLEIEVITDKADDIYASLAGYVLKNNRHKDEQDPVNILRRMVFGLKDSLTERKYTAEELKLIKAKLEFAQDFANEVIREKE